MNGVAAIVPVKRLAFAKSRLSPELSGAERAALATAMMVDVLGSVVECPLVDAAVVITADPEVAATARRCGAHVLTAVADTGYTNAANAGLTLAARAGFATAAVLPGDIPLIDKDALSRVLSTHFEAEGVTLVPAHDGDGTNAFLVSPPDRLRPAFGPASFARHLAAVRAAGLAPHALDVPTIGRDIDWPADLDHLAGTPGGAANTRACLALRRVFSRP